jgi:hypothetical protein
MRVESGISRAAQVIVLSLVLFVLALGAHEVMHLLVLYAVGGHGSIIVRPWRMGMIDASIGSLHVQPDQPLGLVRQLLVNVLGPVLAGLPLAVLLMYVRDPVARAAIAANVAILVFFAVIEGADLLIEELGTFDLGILTTPEFNYGVPLLIMLIAASASSRHRPTCTPRRGEGRAGNRLHRPRAAVERRQLESMARREHRPRRAHALG